MTVNPSSLPASGGPVAVSYVVPAGLSSCSFSLAPPGTPPTCTARAGTHTAQFLVSPNITASPITLTLTFTATPSAGSPSHVSKSIVEKVAAAQTYVALGDELSSGEGNPKTGWNGWTDHTGTATTAPSSTDGCDRSSTAYPVQVSADMRTATSLGLSHLQLAFLACSGATTTDIWSSSPAQSTSGLVGITTNHGESAQASDSADLAHARIVTVSAGGDDAVVGTVLKACAVASLGRTTVGTDLATLIAASLGTTATALFGDGRSLCSATSPVSAIANVMSHIASLEGPLAATYNQIENEAPHAAIYVVGYPDLVPPTPTAAELTNGCGSLKGSLLSFVDKITPAIDAVIARAATATGLTYVNPNAGTYSFLSGAGHTLCSTSSSWFHAVDTASLKASLAGSFLPNSTGEGELARAVERAITTSDAVTTRPALRNVSRVVGDGYGYCALLTTSSVDCWGYGYYGALGNGAFSDSAVPVPVVSTSGTGVLTGVVNLTNDGYGYGYCALLSTQTVDCWGTDSDGELGNASFTASAVPVPVVSPSGTGTLGSVAGLTSDGDGYCALLTSGSVDCWGYGYYGALGNATFQDSAVPVPVVSTTGAGTLTGVASLASDDYGDGFCALLTSGSVDCWGTGGDGELGDASFGDSDVPVLVVSLTGSGALSGVASLTSDAYGNGYCALLTAGPVDCWGYGDSGALGNGSFGDSAVPVTVVSSSGTGTLTTVAHVTSDADGYCAQLSGGTVDCWGNGSSDALGHVSSSNSAVPEPVVSVSGTGALSGVSALTSDGDIDGYCALLTGGSVDCWGDGVYGALGHGLFASSAIPLAVKATTGTGSLTGVTGLTSDGYGDGYCALLTTGSVDCWGYGYYGELGNDTVYSTGNYGSALPVRVDAGAV